MCGWSLLSPLTDPHAWRGQPCQRNARAVIAVPARLIGEHDGQNLVDATRLSTSEAADLMDFAAVAYGVVTNRPGKIQPKD